MAITHPATSNSFDATNISAEAVLIASSAVDPMSRISFTCLRASRPVDTTSPNWAIWRLNPSQPDKPPVKRGTVYFSEHPAAISASTASPNSKALALGLDIGQLLGHSQEFASRDGAQALAPVLTGPTLRLSGAPLLGSLPASSSPGSLWIQRVPEPPPTHRMQLC